MLCILTQINVQNLVTPDISVKTLNLRKLEMGQEEVVLLEFNFTIHGVQLRMISGDIFLRLLCFALLLLYET